MVGELVAFVAAALVGTGAVVMVRRSRQTSDPSNSNTSNPDAANPESFSPDLSSHSATSLSTPSRQLRLSSVSYTTLPSSSSWQETDSIPLHPPDRIDLERFNALLGDAAELKWVGQPLTDIRDLFVKQVILDDETTLPIETLHVPGFIGISDDMSVTDAEGRTVSGHADIAKVLERDGLLICTFQWHKERYGIPLDTRQPMEQELFQEAFAKNEAHHAGAIVPARRWDDQGAEIPSFGAHNEPGSYHDGLFGQDGFVAVAQRLVFPDFVTREQARGYTDSIMCWMGLLNPFVKFPKDNYNGSDPTRVEDQTTLRTFLKNGLLACLGDRAAVRFLNDPTNMTYCAEYIYIALNTVLFPFNQQGLADLLDGDAAKAEQILNIQAQHNNRQPTILTTKSDDAEFEALLSRTPSNPEFDAFHISMPVVPPDLPPLDQFMAEHGAPPPPNRLPFPPFLISQILRRAFRTILPRHRYTGSDRQKLAAAQGRMLTYLELILLQQLGLENTPPDDPRIKRAHQFAEMAGQALSRDFENYAEFDAIVDQVMQKADSMLVGAGDRTRFVPPRIYTDLGQQDGDNNMPEGWGFQLETVGALLSRRAIGAPERQLPMEWRVIQLEQPYLRGDDVKLLQGAMIRAGIAVKADGVFGPASQQAVKEFQARKGIEATGIIDAETRQALGC